MKFKPLEASFGDIVSLDSIIGRYAVYIGYVTIGNISRHLFYPISYSVLMATDKDFMCVLKNSNSAIIIESWNPIYTDNIDITPFTSIDSEYTSALTRFLYYGYLTLPYPDKRFYTGPPIKSNTDIRLLFQQQERKLFLPLSSSTLNSIQLIHSFLPSM